MKTIALSILYVMVTSCMRNHPTNYFEYKSLNQQSPNSRIFALENIVSVDTVSHILNFSDSVKDFFCNNPSVGGDNGHLVFHFSDGTSSRIYIFSRISAFSADLDSPYLVYGSDSLCSSPLSGNAGQILTLLPDGRPSALMRDSLTTLFARIKDCYPTVNFVGSD